MNLEDAGKRFGELTWNQERTAFTAPCPNGADHNVKVTLLAGAAFVRCTNGCDAKQLKSWLNTSGEGPSESLGAQPGAFQVKGGPSPSPDPALWKLRVYHAIDKVLRADSEKGKGMLESMSEADLVDSAMSDAMRGVAAGLFNPLPALSEAEIDEEVASACRGAVKDFLGERRVVVHTNGNGKVVPFIIPFEGRGHALAANEEYLKRTALVEGLCYSAAVSMVTGGKHAGKSTLARWMAICIAKGTQFLDRQVEKGPVLYLASEDETMVARMELLNLGWCDGDPLQFLSMSNVTEEQVKFLESLTQYIEQNGVKLVVMDMLFDFARITDEMSYAQTREALGAIQKIASRGNCHILTVHHAPKNANIGDATVAALGSQGIAARVSPLILVRRFGHGVHSISSTDVRDPRGKAITDSRLLRLEDGSVKLGGAFKGYMLGEVYAPRILDLLESEPGSEMTAPEIATALDISYEASRASLSFLYKNNQLERTGSGKKGRPYRYSVISATTQNPETQNTPQYPDSGVNDPPDNLLSQGRFGYKD